MFAALSFAIGIGLAHAPAPQNKPHQLALPDLLAEGGAQFGGNWPAEPPRYQRCRLYRCGVPELPADLKQRLRDRIDHGDEGSRRK